MYDVMWIKKEIKLYEAAEEEMDKILLAYNSETASKYAIACIKNSSIHNGFVSYKSSCRGAYFAVILGLTNNKQAANVLKSKISEFFRECVNCDYRNFTYDDRLSHMPKPLREYIWSLLLLEGKDAYHWLTQELSKYPELQGAEMILAFAKMICWLDGDEPQTDLSENVPYCFPFFDQCWMRRFILHLKKEGHDVSDENLIYTLKEAAAQQSYENSFYLQWRAKSAIMTIRAVTGDQKYRKVYSRP